MQGEWWGWGGGSWGGGRKGTLSKPRKPKDAAVCERVRARVTKLVFVSWLLRPGASITAGYEVNYVSVLRRCCEECSNKKSIKLKANLCEFGSLLKNIISFDLDDGIQIGETFFLCDIQDVPPAHRAEVAPPTITTAAQFGPSPQPLPFFFFFLIHSLNAFKLSFCCIIPTRCQRFSAICETSIKRAVSLSPHNKSRSNLAGTLRALSYWN